MISFVIATANRPAQLKSCISSLLAQPGCFEIIVIDQSDQNCVSWNKLSKVSVIRMEQRGLSAARNRGVHESRGDIIAFIDDDATLHLSYLKTLESFLSKNPCVAGVAGRVLINSTDRPYAKTQNGTTRPLRANDWMMVLGGNMAFRRAALRTVGAFDERFGSGVSWASGEESDYFFRMVEHEMCMMYLPQLIVYHPIEALGHTSATLRHKLYHYGRGTGALFAKHLGKGRLKMLWYWLWSLCKPAARIVQFALIGKVAQLSVQVAILRGRITGFFEYVD